MKTIFLIVILMGLSALYVRLAPLKLRPVQADVQSDTEMAGGYVAIRPVDCDPWALYARITAIALATPRTTILSENPLRFVTRSRVWGFPDVTTVQVIGGQMTVHAHLVYGKSDFGVNKARVLRWLDQLGPLTRAD